MFLFKKIYTLVLYEVVSFSYVRKAFVMAQMILLIATILVLKFLGELNKINKYFFFEQVSSMVQFNGTESNTSSYLA